MLYRHTGARRRLAAGAQRKILAVFDFGLQGLQTVQQGPRRGLRQRLGVGQRQSLIRLFRRLAIAHAAGKAVQTLQIGGNAQMAAARIAWLTHALSLAAVAKAGNEADDQDLPHPAHGSRDHASGSTSVQGAV